MTAPISSRISPSPSMPEVMAHQGKYPVIYLSLKDVKGNDWESSWAQLRENIMALYLAHSYFMDALSPARKTIFEAITLNKAEQTVFRKFTEKPHHISP